MTPSFQLPLKLLPGTEPLRVGPDLFVLHHPRTGGVWQFGPDERLLLYLIQQLSSPEAVCAAFENRLQRSLPQARLLEFIEQIRSQGLLLSAADVAPAPMILATNSNSTTILPVPLSAADPQSGLNFRFDLLALAFGWLVHPAAAVVYLGLGFLAVLSIINNWDRFTTDELDWWTRFPFVLFFCGMFLQTLLLYNLPRVIFLGLSCRQLGGRIKSLSLRLWESAIPVFHVDLGDSAAMLNEQRRWRLYWSDYWFQVGLGATYVLLWAIARPGSSGGKFFLMMLVPTLSAMFVQGNIFFDSAAYWALCGLTGEWRLRERALPETCAWIFGHIAPEALPSKQRFWFRVYGSGYYLFRWLFAPAMLGLLSYWLISSYSGTGAAVSAIIILWWFHRPVGQLLEAGANNFYFYLGTFLGITSMTRNRTQWTVLYAGNAKVRWGLRLLMLLVLLAIGFLPYRHECAGECRIVPIAQRAVRSQINDELQGVFVSEGDYVEPGQILAALSGRQSNHDFAVAAASLEQEQAKLDLVHAGYRTEEVNAAESKVKVAKTSVEFYENELKRHQKLLQDKATSAETVDKYRKDVDRTMEELIIAQENYSKLSSGYRPEEIRSQEAIVKTKEEDLRYSQEALSLTKITSPIRGRVTTAYMPERQGQNVKAGTVVAVIQDTSKVLVEVAAADTDLAAIQPGQAVHVRLYSDRGGLRTGKVVRVAPIVERDGKYGLSSVATDQSETYPEQNANSRFRSSADHVRVYVKLDDPTPGLAPDTEGYARIVLAEDVLWRAVARPLVKFFRTEVWSWLP